MYLSSSIFESGRKIGGKTSSLHFGLKNVSMFDVLTSCVFSIALRKSMKRGTNSPLRILESGVDAQDHHRVRVLSGEEVDVAVLNLTQETVAVVGAGERRHRELGFLEGFDNALGHLAAVGPYALNGLAVFGDPLLSDLLSFAGRPLTVLLVQNS